MIAPFVGLSPSYPYVPGSMPVLARGKGKAPPFGGGGAF